MLWDHIKRQILAKTVLKTLTVHSAHVASPGVPIKIIDIHKKSTFIVIFLHLIQIN